MRTTQVRGHGLVREGFPHDDRGVPLYQVSSAGPGRAKCSCGEMSEELPSGNQRRKWHREHKENL